MPAGAPVATNLAALRGAPVTHIGRWEDGYWEMVAGPRADVEQHEVRVVPLATMLGLDPTLTLAVQTPVGCGHWREAADAPWRSWSGAGVSPGDDL